MIAADIVRFIRPSNVCGTFNSLASGSNAKDVPYYKFVKMKIPWIDINYTFAKH